MTTINLMEVFTPDASQRKFIFKRSLDLQLCGINALNNLLTPTKDEQPIFSMREMNDSIAACTGGSTFSLGIPDYGKISLAVIDRMLRKKHLTLIKLENRYRDNAHWFFNDRESVHEFFQSVPDLQSSLTLLYTWQPRKHSKDGHFLALRFGRLICDTARKVLNNQLITPEILTHLAGANCSIYAYEIRPAMAKIWRCPKGCVEEGTSVVGEKRVEKRVLGFLTDHPQIS